jgi:RNA exonuclease 1
MFKPIGHFQHVPCPAGSNCYLPNCLFSHERVPVVGGVPVASRADHKSIAPDIKVRKTQHSHAGGRANTTSEHGKVSDDDNYDINDGHEGQRKRRKYVDIDQGDESLGVETEDHQKKYTVEELRAIGKLPQTTSRLPAALPAESSQKVRPTSWTSISPPPVHRGGIPSRDRNSGLDEVKLVTESVAPTTKKIVEEPLFPRHLKAPPASFQTRIKIVQALHKEIDRLNEAAKTFMKKNGNGFLPYTSQEVITRTLDEEENTAIKEPKLYNNIIRQHIMTYKKMTVDKWVESRKKQTNIEKPIQQLRKPVDDFIPTLSPREDLELLRHFKLQATEMQLQKGGFITVAPTEIDIQKAKDGIEAAMGWEKCDRCKTRFQVFPGRRESDGALTTGGECTHHWGKQENIKGSDRRWKCCQTVVGQSAGCATTSCHVFKAEEAKRMAAVLPFEYTPENTSPVTHEGNPVSAVALDCEMSYTTYGLELTRLTVTKWPSGAILIDVLVRPLGEILDLNSRFSGIWPETFAHAIPFDPKNITTDSTIFAPPQKPHLGPVGVEAPPQLFLVPSPAAARSLLFRYLSPETPIIGHALENDLNALRIIHPTIVDTSILYEHPNKLPIRYALKVLMKTHLNKDIQMQQVNLQPIAILPISY